MATKRKVKSQPMDDLRPEIQRLLPWATAEQPALPRLVMIVCIGDAQEPVIKKGDSVLIDREITAFERDGFYLIDHGFSVGIDRVKRMCNGGVIFEYENPKYTSRVIAPCDLHKYRVLGRVSFLGHIL